MVIQCTFDSGSFHNGKFYYKCLISKSSIPENIEQVRFSGHHSDKKSHDDVTFVYFDDCFISRVPQGLTNLFPNLKILWINSSRLSEIWKEDLVEYRSIKEFGCTYNFIEFLPGNLFEGFKNLTQISFCGNKLEIIEPHILNGLDKLKVVNFSGNPNFDKFFSNISGYNLNANATLQEVKNQIFENFLSSFHNLRNNEATLRMQIFELKKFETELIEQKKQNKILESKANELSCKLEKRFFGDIKAYIQKNSTKDFKINIDGQKFSAHKFILAARSPTLAEILNKNPEAHELNLVDISVDVFEKILSYLYTDELPGCQDNSTNFKALFVAAARLKITELMDLTALKISETIHLENPVEILKLSSKYEHEGLKDAAFNEIKITFPNVPFKDEWKTDIEMIIKAVDAFHKKEEMMKKIQANFENLFE